MQETLHAIFAEAGNAEKAAGALLDNGVRAEDLTVIQNYMEPKNESLDDRADAESATENAAKSGISTTTPGDAGIGAAKGAGWGLGLGAVAGLACLFIPGVGLVIGGGALAVAIGAAAATTGAGAVAGAVTGYLKDQGFEEEDGVRYAEVVKNGGAILSLTLPSGDLDEPKAWEIIDKYNGEPFSSGVRTTGAPYVA